MEYEAYCKDRGYETCWYMTVIFLGVGTLSWNTMSKLLGQIRRDGRTKLHSLSCNTYVMYEVYKIVSPPCHVIALQSEALASLADTTSGLTSSFSQRNAQGTGTGVHHAHHPNPWAASPASTVSMGAAAAVRLALVDRGQTGAGSFDREKARNIPL